VPQPASATTSTARTKRAVPARLNTSFCSLGRAMVHIVEVFWNARPYLARAGLRVDSGLLDPRAETLFNRVRCALADAFPGCVTLTRIITRKQITGELRVLRCGVLANSTEIERVRRHIDAAAELALAEARTSQFKALA
jgi:hypothetical protein